MTNLAVKITCDHFYLIVWFNDYFKYVPELTSSRKQVLFTTLPQIPGHTCLKSKVMAENRTVSIPELGS